MSAAPLLELKNVTAYRGSRKVLENFSLTIERNEHAAIIGPNGAGKSTLLKLLTREIYPAQLPDSGVSVMGRTHWRLWELQQQLGMISYDLQREYLDSARGGDVVLSGFYASIGVWDHQSYTDEQKRQAESLMRELGVASLAARPFNAMSTGEQRRFLLARALVHDPDTLVLDEPTSGLDMATCFLYIDLIRHLMTKGRSVLLVTHHLHEIPPEIERVILLKKGVVIDDGPKENMLTSEKISALFETPLHVHAHHGFYQVFPAHKR